MNANRFETFYDAVLAIVITILVLKIPQPLGPTWGAFSANYLTFSTYFIVFLAIINIWYNNHKLFQNFDEINNMSLFAYGFSLFLTTLFPYFALWISMNLFSLTAETVFGLIILFANISHIIALFAVFGAMEIFEKVLLKQVSIKFQKSFKLRLTFEKMRTIFSRNPENWPSIKIRPDHSSHT